MSDEKQSLVGLLSAFRAGQTSAGNELLKRHEPWLRLLARLQVESRFRAKFDPSDIVQQAMMEAVRAIPQFRGQSEAEFRAWLRRILAHVLSHEIRRYQGTQKRALNLEKSMESTLEQTSLRLGEVLPASATSPSQALVRREQQVQLAAVLERLPEDYREVIVLRHLQGLSHEQIAQRLGRNPGAVRMLWIRALARLREELAGASGEAAR